MPATEPDTSRCPACGAGNGCAIAAGTDPALCWCMDRPQVPLPPDAFACYCPACLQRLHPGSTSTSSDEASRASKGAPDAN